MTMNTLNAAILALLATVASGCAASRQAAAPEQPFPLEEYKAARSEVHSRLNQLAREYSPRLRTGTTQEQQRAMKDIAEFAGTYLAPHPRQVEVLYTFADRRAGPRFTESMRYEHNTFAIDIRYFRTMADAPQPDVELFRSKLGAYFACMWSHLDREDMIIGSEVVEHEIARRGPIDTTCGAD